MDLFNIYRYLLSVYGAFELFVNVLPVYLGECMLLALNPIKNDLKICDAFTSVNSVWKGLIRMYVHPLFKFDKIL